MGRLRTQELGEHQDFALRLREALDLVGLSPNDQSYQAIGKELGVSGTMVGYMLNGDKLPSLNTAVAIALRTGVCVEWLLTGRGPLKPAGVQIEPGAAQDISEALTLIQGLAPEGRSIVLSMIRAAAGAKT